MRLDWKWILLVPLTLFLIGCTADEADAQLFRRNTQPNVVVVSSPTGGGGQFDFQHYMHWKVLLAISENRQRIERLEGMVLQAKIEKLRNDISANTQARLAPLPTAQPQTIAPQYVPAYNVQIRTNRRITPRVVRRE